MNAHSFRCLNIYCFRCPKFLVSNTQLYIGGIVRPLVLDDQVNKYKAVYTPSQSRTGGQERNNKKTHFVLATDRPTNRQTARPTN